MMTREFAVEKDASPAIHDRLIAHPFRYGAAVIVLLLVSFFLNFRKDDLSSRAEQWGQFGDYMGGILNPVFGLISVVLVAATLRSQTAAANRQAFENHFFALLSLHDSVLKSIDKRLKDGRVQQGRDCFVHFYKKIVKISERERVPMATAYHRFIETDGYEVEHYFRTVYHMFRHVKDGARSIHASDSEKKRYYDLIKSQLSQYELVILYFNVQSINKGNWQSILSEPQAQPFEHLNKANLIENPPPSDDEP